MYLLYLCSLMNIENPGTLQETLLLPLGVYGKFCVSGLRQYSIDCLTTYPTHTNAGILKTRGTSLQVNLVGLLLGEGKIAVKCLLESRIGHCEPDSQFDPVSALGGLKLL